MQLKNDESRYGVVAQLFHWTIVVLIIVQFILANRADDLPLGTAKIAVLAQHKSFGITILGLALLRLLWRWFNPVPAEPLDIPQWQRIAARVSHIGLYALLLVTPVVGWLMSSARNFPVSWFGLVTLPDFIEPNRPAYEFLHETHELLAGTLFWLALLHVAAALKHHFIDKDNVLRRMLPVKLKQDRS
ncbi:cytochrome b [Steroidobacter agaridevorans]|uniref:Cytochrome b n=1 Tax=Steroidobacter agaridevorans TaxID=2695856 RepID=A0A829YDM9_9GAMM|nr:cytochrome b [Steroidobacter agaridevorans]GFE80911.1 cytochrome b [Steroidobacter agaridevorans]